MTPSAMFGIAFDRAGIHRPTTDQTSRAREYLNIISTDVENMAKWRFLYRTSTIATVDGTRSYSLASDVLYPLNFWDTTNNRTLTTRNPEDITDLDPDEDFESESRLVSVTGINTTTGYWEVDLFPTPDTSAEEIKYRYYATIADLASAADDVDLGPKYPKWLQNALLWGLCAIYKEEKNLSSTVEWERQALALKAGLRVNEQVNVLPDLRLGRSYGDRSFIVNATIVPD